MTIPPLAEAQEKPFIIPPEELVILQPKFDGCQAILIPSTNGYAGFTRKGQEIIRLREQAAQLTKLGVTQVFFCEYEPKQWSEEAKHKLAGNLYSTDPLPFESTLRVFDCMDATEFQLGAMKRLPCKPRLLVLDTLKAQLAQVGMLVVPWQEMPYRDAKALCKSARVETEDGTRCNILGHLVEGGIIRAGHRLEKDKAKMDMDICVLLPVVSVKGQRGWVAVDTKKPTEQGLMIVFGGVTPKNHTQFIGKVVEVDLLTVSGVEGGGNPTFKRDRSNEKDFNAAEFIRTQRSALANFLKRYDVSEARPAVN